MVFSHANEARVLLCSFQDVLSVVSVVMWLLGYSKWLIIGLNQGLDKDWTEQIVWHKQMTVHVLITHDDTEKNLFFKTVMSVHAG